MHYIEIAFMMKTYSCSNAKATIFSSPVLFILSLLEKLDKD